MGWSWKNRIILSILYVPFNKLISFYSLSQKQTLGGTMQKWTDEDALLVVWVRGHFPHLDLARCARRGCQELWLFLPSGDLGATREDGESRAPLDDLSWCCTALLGKKLPSWCSEPFPIIFVSPAHCFTLCYHWEVWAESSPAPSVSSFSLWPSWLPCSGLPIPR